MVVTVAGRVSAVAGRMVVTVAGRVSAVAGRVLPVAGRVVTVATSAAASVAIIMSLSGAVELSHGPAGLVDDVLILEGAERVLHANAHVLLLHRVSSVEDSVADSL